MKDLINRQAAIDLVESFYKIDKSVLDIMVFKLKQLPSAEPEIIRCRDCKHHDGIRCFRWNSTIITGFDDFCSNAERRTDE